jgi:hypothetical protein
MTGGAAADGTGRFGSGFGIRRRLAGGRLALRCGLADLLAAAGLLVAHHLAGDGWLLPGLCA